MDQKINLYNTATRKKDLFKPVKEGEVGIYSCGPTVYWSPHIGNMYAYVSWDVLVKSLRYLGYKVTQVMNLTDVGHLTSDGDTGEDKMEKGARREGVSVWDIAKKYTDEFYQAMKMLNIGVPDVVCKATDNIQEQIDLIKRIEANGFAYIIGDGVYFDTSKFSGYATFANLDLDKIREGARVEANEEKRNPSDFALWKFSPKDGPKRQMEWDSPWGVGFPGWHIECTAMSVKYLGEIFDIHTGGEDHISVHHTNEIAQGYGAFGHQTANYWMHNAFITTSGEKVSKSAGGLYTVPQLEELGFDTVAYRYLAISSHYRKGLDFSLNSLKAAQTALNKMRDMIKSFDQGGEVNREYRELFANKLADDLSMPEALALAWKLLKDEKISGADKRATLEDFDRVFSFDLLKESVEEPVPVEVTELFQQRIKARTEANWSESDRLRDLIREKGYLVEDLKNECKIRKI